MANINDRVDYYLSNLNEKINIDIDLENQKIFYFKNGEHKMHPMYYTNSLPCIFLINKYFNKSIFKDIWDQRLKYLKDVKKISNKYTQPDNYYYTMNYEFDTYCKTFIDKIFEKSILIQTGDVHFNTPIPIITKTRPISINDSNEKINNVIFRLEINRHWFNPIKEVIKNDILFNEKNNKIVWRGASNGFLYDETRPSRLALCKKYNENSNPMIDIGFVNNYEDLNGKGKLSIAEQLKSKFIISLEGGDVGTGLKWMLYSNSTVIMPKPTMEGWFMEGLLEPWVHYVPLKNDFSDLEEKYEWCLNNLEKCEEIATNGKKYMEQFLDEDTEKKIETLIIQKYNELVEINLINEKNNYSKSKYIDNSFVLNTLSYKKDNNLRFYIEKQEDYLHTISKLFKKTINKFEMDFYAFGYPKNNFSNDLVKMDNLLSNASENDLFIFNELIFQILENFTINQKILK